MTNATYQQLALDWHPQSKTDKSFALFVAFILMLTLGAAMFIATIEVPADTKREKIVIPERVAKFILDKPKPKPKPIIIKKPKPKPKPKPIKKELPKPKKEEPKVKEIIKVKKQPPKKERVLTKKQVKARDKASKSGLLALSNELADLMDTSGIDDMVGNKLSKGKGGTDALVLASNNSSNVLTAGASKGSGGVSGRKVGSGGTSNVTLNKSEVAAAQQALLASRADTKIVKNSKKVDKSATKPSKKKKRTGNYRPEEDIAYVMDKNKSKLHALYRKARRTNPNIKGKIVLEITISPAGKVLKVAIASSELDDKKLEKRIVARVKKFNFGADNVKAVTVTYPIEFLPS